MELKHRNQKQNKTLKEFESDIARLAQVSDAEAVIDSLDQVSTVQFVDGIRHLKMK